MNNYTISMIGTYDSPFKGYLNGYGHVISNFKISGTSQYVGLFPSMEGTIERIGFDNVSITSTVTGNGNNYCGLVAYMNSNGLIKDTWANIKCSITGSYYNYCGGLVGYLNGGIIQNSYTIGSVSATGTTFYSYAGGIVGYFAAGTISSCFSSADVTAKGASVVFSYNGGLVGEINADNAILTNCYRCDEAKYTKYESTGSYNNSGTLASRAEIMEVFSTLWNNSVWKFNHVWPALVI